MRVDSNDNLEFYSFNKIHLINKKIKKQGYKSSELLKDRATRSQVIVQEIGTNKSKKILN